jgi:hypothetical protein
MMLVCYCMSISRWSAVAGGHLEAVTVILQAGADPNFACGSPKWYCDIKRSFALFTYLKRLPHPFSPHQYSLMLPGP